MAVLAADLPVAAMRDDVRLVPLRDRLGRVQRRLLRPVRVVDLLAADRLLPAAALVDCEMMSCKAATVPGRLRTNLVDSLGYDLYNTSVQVYIA